MIEDFSVAQKLGCAKHALDNCILVKASVEAVSTVIQQYFALEVRSNCKIADYVGTNEASWTEVERQRQVRKSKPKEPLFPVIWAVPFWQYINHQ